MCLLLSAGSCEPNGGGNPQAFSGTPTDTLSRLGYDAVALPSTAYGPGSLVTSVKGSGMEPPLRLTYLCRPDFTANPPAIVDAAASSTASRALSTTFDAGASALGDLGPGIGAAANFVNSISIEFNNVKVEQLAFDDLALVRSSLGPACADLLADFASRDLAFQTKQAVRADVVYRANLKAGVSAGVKNAVIEALSATFDAAVSNVDDTSVTGVGLYYGLVLVPVPGAAG